jgi:hypothetical protein
MTISGDGGGDGLPIEFLLPLYPDDPWYKAPTWKETDAALIGSFEAALLDYLPKVLTSARRLVAAGWKLRMTVAGFGCTPPEDVEDVGDWLEGEEWPWADYFRRLGLPVHPVEACGAPRSLPEIMEAMEEACDRTWYTRSVNHMICTRDDPMNPNATIPPPEVMSGALRSQMRMEEKYGKEDLEKAASDPFETGMLNGKLSSLRWVLGDPWVMLDT